jgi:uncharacterized protein (DUF488 family)
VSPVVWTIGHSTRAATELIALLREHDIQLLLDVRSLPRSRRNPQFEQAEMQQWVPAAGLIYRHQPGLGGRRTPNPDSDQQGVPEGGLRGYADFMQTAAFDRELERMLELACNHRTAIMCAEADPAKCHRAMICDALVVREVDVVHILSRDHTRPHVLASAASVVGGRVRYPGPPGLFDGMR